MDPENISPPQEPRLSIMHLLVWTACVAVYFSFIRTRAQYVQAQYTSGPGVFPVLYGLGFGTALAGLVLLASRRLRGFPLAKHPGEYLLLSAGASLVFVVVTQVVVTERRITGRVSSCCWRGSNSYVIVFAIAS